MFARLRECSSQTCQADSEWCIWCDVAEVYAVPGGAPLSAICIFGVPPIGEQSCCFLTASTPGTVSARTAKPYLRTHMKRMAHEIPSRSPLPTPSNSIFGVPRSARPTPHLWTYLKCIPEVTKRFQSLPEFSGTKKCTHKLEANRKSIVRALHVSRSPCVSRRISRHSQQTEQSALRKIA